MCCKAGKALASHGRCRGLTILTKSALRMPAQRLGRLGSRVIVEVPPSTRHPEQHSGFPPLIRSIGPWTFPACALACGNLSARIVRYPRGCAIPSARSLGRLCFDSCRPSLRHPSRSAAPSVMMEMVCYRVRRAFVSPSFHFQGCPEKVFRSPRNSYPGAPPAVFVQVLEI